MQSSSSALHEAYTLFAKKDYEKAYQVLQNKANHSSQQLHNATLLLHGFVAPNSDALFQELEQIAPKITEPKTSDVARYNQALLCIQYRRMELANKYLLPLRQKLDKMDEYLAARVCFTLLEVLFHTAAPSAQEITYLLDFVERTSKKLMSSTTTTSPDSQQSAASTLHVQDIKLAYHLYKFRWHTLQHDTASAEKELLQATALNKIKTVTYQAQLSFLKNIADNADSMFVLLDGATMEHSCGYWNNAGCILNKQGKHHCAYLCFTKAYSFAQQSTAISKQSMIISCLNNMALSLLTYLKRPLDAFYLFVALVQDKPNYARYWIRLAECCIAHVHQHRNLHSPVAHQLVKNQQTGQALYVRLPTRPAIPAEPALPITTKSTTAPHSSIVESHHVEQDKLLFQAGPSLMLAEKCLKNASSLAIHHTIDMLFIYCKLAHVYLLLDDPALCTFYAYKILKTKAQQHSAMTNTMIMQLVMHASEALCKMDKYAEALSLIQSHMNEFANNSSSFTMRTIVTLIMNQQLEKAQALCKSLPPSNYATLLQIYIYMYSGNRQALWNMFHVNNNST